MKKQIIIMSVLAAVVLSAVIFFNTVRLQEITIEGNHQISSEKVEDYLFGGEYGKYSVVAWFRYWRDDHIQMPFVEKYTIEWTSLTSAKVTVYEKSIVGYFMYMGNYVYFDKDGIVVQSSGKEIKGIPLVTGLQCDHLTLYEKLPVKDDKVFDRLAKISRLLKKYNLVPKEIQVDEELNLTLKLDQYTLLLGHDNYLEEKMDSFWDFSNDPRYKDAKGTLNMVNYNEKGVYVFKNN